MVIVSGCRKASPSVPDAGPQQTPDAGSAPDAGKPVQVQITATVNSTRFVTREHFLAAAEMQISGEPFAENMGRQLSGYSRDHLPTDIYFDSSPLSSGSWIDLVGFSTAVESYEYSKQPMNNVALESGAGTSLLFGPLVNPDAGAGNDALSRMATLVQHFASGSNAVGKWVFPPNTFPVNDGGGDLNAHGTGQPSENPLGWPGLWPTLHVFQSFDPTIQPTSDTSLSCSISSDDDPGASGSLGSADYECDYTTLHLLDRTNQADFSITPGADGFSAWKYGLWCLNYLQIMHDSTEAAVAYLDGDDGGLLLTVGNAGNQVVGDDGTGAATAPGTFLGSSDIEGFQSQMFIEEMDNRAEDWLRRLSTADGVTFSGFPTLLAADSYAYDSPLRWFPGVIAVAEADDPSGFPKPVYFLESPDSHLLDQIGLVLGFSEFYALTDQSNKDVGGAQTSLVYFDGDPFPADDQIANGDPTLHDRALGMIRVALVNIDRLHTDPTSGLLVDDVTMNGTTPTRGHTLSTTSLAYTLLGLRTALRTLGSQLELYSNNTPDTALATTPLDTLPINYPNQASLTFTQRVRQIQLAEGNLLYEHLTNDKGQAFDGWDVAANAPVDQQDLLDSHTAAVRGLFSMYLATGDIKYRDRAMAVFNRIESVFYDEDARLYSSTPAPVDSVEYTPLRFALLQSTLRDVYELVAARPGGEDMEPDLEARIARLNKLVLNGWDDRNRNSIVDWPDECVNSGFLPDGGILPHGGLQMAERTLTGEIGSLQDIIQVGQQRLPTTDREHDCVPEIDDAQLPSALADSVTFHVSRQ
jgi:hypothetical protein